MTALVTKHLPLVTGAPDGIKKLRALILELAVRGKLVPHEPSEESVATLLERTAAAKAALQPRGRVKVKKSLSDFADDYPYVIPSGWKWCRLADLVEVLNGRAYKKEELLEEGTPVLRVGNLFTSNHWYYSDLILDDERYCLPGDLLYAWSASFGPFIWTGERSIYHYHIWKLAPHSDADLNRRYLHDYLRAQTAAIKAAGHGVSMTHMTKEKMELLPVPLPPLAEQHRIVAKVDELMALCDRLEAEQADAEAAHAQLVQALLDSLTQATDAADFRASWQRLSEHFHTLFTTEASIDALKQAVLQLAVMGKLVQQDPGEESVETLIKHLLEKQARLRETAGLRTTAGIDVPASERYLEIPTEWTFFRLGNLAKFIDYRGRTPVKTETGVSLVTAKNVRRGFISRDPAEFIADDAYSEWMTRGIPKPGDLLFTTEAPLGNVAAIDIQERFALAQRVICFQLHLAAIGPFLKVALLSPAVQEQIAAMATGMTATGVKSSRLKELPVPLPPLPEQQRIVAKVDELMALCNQLQAQLAEAHEQHAQLSTALVEKAIA